MSIIDILEDRRIAVRFKEKSELREFLYEYLDFSVKSLADMHTESILEAQCKHGDCIYAYIEGDMSLVFSASACGRIVFDYSSLAYGDCDMIEESDVSIDVLFMKT